MKTFFISDLHFGHENILHFDNRPFPTIAEHDAALINNWNDTVNVNDEVWILGDISWYPVNTTVAILNLLNGNKNLCVGNHDGKFIQNADFRNCFKEIVDYKELRLNSKTKIILSHFPMPYFNNHYYEWKHLYGHVHTSFEWNMAEHDKFLMENLYATPCKMYNVGCMVPYMKYKPQTIEEIEKNYQKYIEQNNKGV